MPKKILITGGAGFIGRHVVSNLLTRGYKVRVLDLAERPPEFPEEVEYVRGSVLNDYLLGKTINGVQVVYHLAADPNLWAKDKNKQKKVNIEGARRVMKACDDFDIEKVVYTSTGTILQSCKNKNPGIIDEQCSLPSLEDMAGPYSKSKWLAEMEVRKWAEQGLPVVIVYPTIPIGPGDVNFTPPTRMLYGFIKNRIPAYLDVTLNLIPVQEVAEGHILAAERGEPGDRFILANRDLRLSEILTFIENQTGKRMPVFKVPYSLSLATAYCMEALSSYFLEKEPAASVEGVRLGRMKMKFSSVKAREKLGLPEYSVHQALAESIKWIEGLKAAQPEEKTHLAG